MTTAPPPPAPRTKTTKVVDWDQALRDAGIAFDTEIQYRYHRFTLPVLPHRFGPDMIVVPVSHPNAPFDEPSIYYVEDDDSNSVMMKVSEFLGLP